MEIKKILVVGAGTMGHGIAQSFAMAGYEVSLQDQVPEALDRARSLMQSSLDTMVEAGVVDRAAIPSILGRIHPTSDLAQASSGADLALECVFE